MKKILAIIVFCLLFPLFSKGYSANHFVYLPLIQYELNKQCRTIRPTTYIYEGCAWINTKLVKRGEEVKINGWMKRFSDDGVIPSANMLVQGKLISEVTQKFKTICTTRANEQGEFQCIGMVPMEAMIKPNQIISLFLGEEGIASFTGIIVDIE